MKPETRPIIAIIIKDPRGSDPDTICGVLAGKELYGRIRPVVIGDFWCMAEAVLRHNSSAGLSNPKEIAKNGLRAIKIRCPANGIYMGGMIDVIDMNVTKKAFFDSNTGAGAETDSLAKEAFRHSMDHAEAVFMAGGINAALVCPGSEKELIDKLQKTVAELRKDGRWGA